MNILLLSFEKDETAVFILEMIKQELNSLDMQCTIIYAEEDMHACIHCRKCRKKKACIFDNDCINEIIQSADGYGGIIILGREYYGRADKNLKNLLERLCTAGSCALALKPASVFLLARNNDAAVSFDDIFRMLSNAGVLVVTSGSLPVIYDSTLASFQKDRLANAIVMDLVHAMAWTVHSLNGENHPRPDFTAGSIRKLIR